MLVHSFTDLFRRHTPSISPLERLLNHLHCSLTPAAVISGCPLLTQVLVKGVTVPMGRSTPRNHLPSKQLLPASMSPTLMELSIPATTSLTSSVSAVSRFRT